jgi:TIGR03009 family protein
MRRTGLALPALLLAAALATAQQPATAPPAPPAAAPADPKLDGYLRRWEAEMQKVQSLAAQLTRVEKDQTFNATRKLSGTAYYMKVGTGPTAQNLALLEMNLEGQKELAEKVVITGTYLYQYAPAAKEIRAFEIPRPKPGQVGDESVLSLLFGVPAAEANRRYDLRLEKEDAHYIYVLVGPRDPRDRADFEQARVVLNKTTFLPRQLWFKQPNKNEMLWDIPRIDANVRLDRRAFDAPTAPPGWKLVQVPRGGDVPPRVQRNSGNP